MTQPFEHMQFSFDSKLREARMGVNDRTHRMIARARDEQRGRKSLQHHPGYHRVDQRIIRLGALEVGEVFGELVGGAPSMARAMNDESPLPV